jgi:hypothetical protein
MITFKEFYQEIFDFVAERPAGWRKGQAVFNYIDQWYGDLARTVQFQYGIDCFYDDNKCEEFISKCYDIMKFQYERYGEIKKNA